MTELENVQRCAPAAVSKVIYIFTIKWLQNEHTLTRTHQKPFMIKEDPADMEGSVATANGGEVA